MEVGGASSLNECWALVRTSQATGKSCMMLENCCYGKVEMQVLNMVKKGLFGELVHCQGGYEHDLREEIGMGDINRHYRQENFAHRNGELYPTHELGPIAKLLELNRGNRMTHLTSMASKARGMKEWTAKHRQRSSGGSMPRPAQNHRLYAAQWQRKDGGLFWRTAEFRSGGTSPPAG